MARGSEQLACPEDIRPLFNRSLFNVVCLDYLPTLDHIRQLYIPRHSPVELADFPQALIWVRENLGSFQEAGFGINGLGFDDLPEEVKIHKACIGFLLLFGEELLGMPVSSTDLLVAYQPETAEWIDDVQFILNPHFKRYEGWVLRTDSLTPEDLSASISSKDSTTKSLALLKIAFNSDWKECREESSDALTAELWLRYWVALKRRLKFLLTIKG